MSDPTPTPREPIRDALTAGGVRTGAVRRTVVRVVVTLVGLIGIYSVVPVAGASRANELVLMLCGLVAFFVLVARQVRKIVHAEYPRLRAIEALLLVVPTLILLFAYTYLCISEADPAGFSEPLTRIDAAYFATTTFATVGFGDITARTEPTRLIVTLQMIVGLGAVVGLARLMLGAANLGLSSRADSDSAER